MTHVIEDTLTPIHDSGKGWLVKREDLAYYTGPDMPSGAKIRQYTAMINQSPDDAVLAIGCRSVSATQVYLGAMHVLTGRPAYVCVAETKQESPSTMWAREHGVEFRKANPGYPNVYRKRMREWLAEMNVPAVRWDRKLATEDTAAQVANLPDGVKRIVVPSGSGLQAAGVYGGLIQQNRTDVKVVVGAVATQAMTDCVEGWVNEFFGEQPSYNIEHVQVPGSVNKPAFYDLPDGVPLDPYYSAKMIPILQQGDLLWAVGRRPMAAAVAG